jgi:hypothetical protein
MLTSLDGAINITRSAPELKMSFAFGASCDPQFPGP